MGSRTTIAFAVIVAVLTAGEGPSAQAAFPGANGKIAFNSNVETCDAPGCAHSIFSVDPDGSAFGNLAAFGETPSWSADGTRLAYASTRGGAAVFVREPDGTRLRLTDNGPFVFDGQPSWSPDGSRIAFVSSRTGVFEIYVMSADGSEQTRVTDSRADGLGLDSTQPAWSPDGSRIAFTRNIRNPHTNDYEIYVVNPDGTGLRRLTFNLTPDSLFSNRNDMGPNWSPDGSRIVFASGRPGPLNIYSMDADGGDVVRLTERPSANFEPAFSPDGTKIAFVGGPQHLLVMNADGTNETDLTPTSRGDYRNPDWQPIPPKRGDYKNASLYCKALRDFLGNAEFGKRYKNHGECVSANH